MVHEAIGFWVKHVSVGIAVYLLSGMSLRLAISISARLSIDPLSLKFIGNSNQSTPSNEMEERK